MKLLENKLKNEQHYDSSMKLLENEDTIDWPPRHSKSRKESSSFVVDCTAEQLNPQNGLSAYRYTFFLHMRGKGM
jgi:hypothetical protein